MKSITRQVCGQTQEDLVRLFDNLAQRHSRWEVWTDFVYITAATLSNVVDKSHFDWQSRK